MIPTEHNSRGNRVGAFSQRLCLRPARRDLHQPRATLVRLLRLGVLLGSAWLATGCTNSKLIIGPLYNQLDDQIRSEFNKLGNYNDRQHDAFEAAVGTFHVWHRQSELPGYAALLDDMAQALAAPSDPERRQVHGWISTAERYSQSVRECYPLNYLFGMVKTLTDEQLDFMEQRFKREREKNRERYASRSAEERVEHRLKNMIKWAGRINLNLTTRQRVILRRALEQQISLRKEYYQLTDSWNRQLFTLARNQQSPTYQRDLKAHMSKLWNLLETHHPEQWRQNRALWQDTAFELVSDLSPGQRRQSSQWLAKMSRTLQSISEDEPSFKPGNDPSVGCLSDSTS